MSGCIYILSLYLIVPSETYLFYSPGTQKENDFVIPSQVPDNCSDCANVDRDPTPAPGICGQEGGPHCNAIFVNV